MTKKLIAASLVGLAVVVSAPAFAGSGNPWVQELKEMGVTPDPFQLPSAQVNKARNQHED